MFCYRNIIFCLLKLAFAKINYRNFASIVSKSFSKMLKIQIILCLLLFRRYFDILFLKTHLRDEKSIFRDTVSLIQGKLDVLCGTVHVCGWLTKAKQIYEHGMLISIHYYIRVSLYRQPRQKRWRRKDLKWKTAEK